MTRLSSELISGMRETIAAYDLELVQKSGLTLRQIAARTAGLSEKILCEAPSFHNTLLKELDIMTSIPLQ